MTKPCASTLPPCLPDPSHDPLQVLQCATGDTISLIRDALPGLIGTPVFEGFLQIVKVCQPGPEPDLSVSQVRALAIQVRNDLRGTEVGESFATLVKALQPGARKAGTKARPLVNPANRNLTSEWLQKNWERVLPSLRTFLHEKLPTSRFLSTLDDHLQGFALKMIERDEFRSEILKGKTVRLSVLKIWCYHAACSEIRGWGTDASLRTSRGALTTRNREALSKGDAHVQDFVERGQEVVYDLEDRLGSEKDIWSPDSRSVEDDAAFNETMEICRKAIQERIQGAGDRYTTLFEQLTEGFNRTQLAEKEGVSQNRMATMLGKLRVALRDIPID